MKKVTYLKSLLTRYITIDIRYLSILFSESHGGPKEGDPFALISARSADGTKPSGGGTLLP